MSCDSYRFLGEDQEPSPPTRASVRLVPDGGLPLPVFPPAWSVKEGDVRRRLLPPAPLQVLCPDSALLVSPHFWTTSSPVSVS